MGYIPTSAFHTFDPIRLSPLEIVDAISSSMNGFHEDLISTVGKVSGVVLKEGEPSPLDKANLLFISIIDWQKDGSSPRPLDGGHSRERLGRFPHNDGNAIEYLLEFTREAEEMRLHELLSKLTRGLSKEYIGREGFSRGSGGIELLGWLDSSEVNELRGEIEGSRWSVLSEEPLDGGVQDAFRHLLVYLRSAGRGKCGIMMRRHS